MYDLIGDIHGHADELQALLEKLGYRPRQGSWWHPQRRVIFLGDFIDRGPDQRNAVAIPKAMVEAGTALAVMGNHEFNAIAWASRHPPCSEDFLRPHSVKNRRQHQTYLTQVGEDSALHREHIDWFKTLPLYLDLPELRVVHACWDPASLDRVSAYLDSTQRVLPRAWPALSLAGSPAFEATEVLLKGMEIRLPDGAVFHDKDGTVRHDIRTRWWQSGSLSYRDAALVPDDVLDTLPQTPLPPGALPGYRDDKPLFIGHYWLTGTPQPLTSAIACLDYSIAGDAQRGGQHKLCAYRWKGEKTLRSHHMVWVERQA